MWNYENEFQRYQNYLEIIIMGTTKHCEYSSKRQDGKVYRKEY